MGRVARAYGSAGELILTLFDTFPAEYNTKEPLFVVIDGLAVPLFCDRFERRGRSSVRVLFADFETERRAGELIGLELSLEVEQEEGNRKETAPEGEIYPEDLIGWTAHLGDSQRGVIEDFIAGENPLFRITVGEKEVLVPVVDEFIVEIDEVRRVVELELPEGLLDLY